MEGNLTNVTAASSLAGAGVRVADGVAARTPWCFGGHAPLRFLWHVCRRTLDSDMRRRLPSILPCVLAALALSACAPAPVPEAATAHVGGRIIDGRGGTPIEDGIIILRGASIVALGPRSRVEVPSGATVFDVSGMSIVPGLIESNVVYARRRTR